MRSCINSKYGQVFDHVRTRQQAGMATAMNGTLAKRGQFKYL